MDILEKFGNTIRNIRLSQNISQEKLAELSNLHRTYIGMVERGERNISLRNIEKIAIALKVNIKSLCKDL